MKSIAFFNNKGGVGKTTLLCNVAAYFSQEFDKKVCVVDADPQCNATQYLLEEEDIQLIYSSRQGFTIYNVVEPLSYGDGYSEDIQTRESKRFNVDVLAGDPQLALTEDLLARDWADARAGEVRGIRTSLVFAELLSKLTKYDYVFFDVSPSLGAINRSILLASDAFVSPITVDIFSLMAFENISRWINEWWSDWCKGLDNVRSKSKIPDLKFGKSKFLGYVMQQYIARNDGQGRPRAVQAYEKIRKNFDAAIQQQEIARDLSERRAEIGAVPNLFSLVPMSQMHHVPIFNLAASEGVVGAHFAKVKEAREIFRSVSTELRERAQ